MAPRTFAFDAVFSGTAQQGDVFAPLRGMVEGTLAGYNASILAYGPSGAGKTHSILGSAASAGGDVTAPQTWGILQRSLAALFAAASSRAEFHTTVKLTFVELHCNKFRDLLAPAEGPAPTVTLRDSPAAGVFLSGSPTLALPVDSVEEALAAIAAGTAARAVGVTDLNQHSSRSHAVVLLDVVSTPREGVGGATRHGRLFVADLAGSERLAAGGAGDATTQAETQAINSSLAALTDVLSALSGGQGEGWLVPYRNNKLTHLLREALGGASRTVLLVHAAEAPAQHRPTLQSLAYATRAKRMAAAPVAALTFDGGGGGGSVPAGELEAAKAALDATTMELAGAQDMYASATAQVAALQQQLAAAQAAAHVREEELMTELAAAEAEPAPEEVQPSPTRTPVGSVEAPSPAPSPAVRLCAALQTSPSLLESAVAQAVHPRVADALLTEKATLEAALADKYDELTAQRVAAAESAAREAEQAHWSDYAADLRARLSAAEGSSEDAVATAVAAARAQWEETELPAAVTAAAEAAAAATDSEVMAEYAAKLELWKSKAKEAVGVAKGKIAAARAEAAAGAGAASAAKAEVARLKSQLAAAADPLAAPTPSKAFKGGRGKPSVQLRAAVTRLRAERTRRKELEQALQDATAQADSHAAAVAAREQEVADITNGLTEQMAAALGARERALVLAQHDTAAAECDATRWRLAAHRARVTAVGAVGATVQAAEQVAALQTQVAETVASRDALAQFTVALVRDLQDALLELEEVKAAAAAAQDAAAAAEAQRQAALATAASSVAAKDTAAAVAEAQRDAQWKGMTEALRALQSAGLGVPPRASGGSRFSGLSGMSGAVPSDSDAGMPLPYTGETSEEEGAPTAGRQRPRRRGKRAGSRPRKAARGGATSDSSYVPAGGGQAASPPSDTGDLAAFSGESPATLALMKRVARRSLSWAAEGRRSLDGGAAGMPESKASDSPPAPAAPAPVLPKAAASKPARAASGGRKRATEAKAKAAKAQVAKAAKVAKAEAAKAAKVAKAEAAKAAKAVAAAADAAPVEAKGKAGGARKRPRAAGKGKAAAPAAAAAKENADEFAVPSTESGSAGLFSAAELTNVQAGAGTGTGVGTGKKRRMLGKGQEALTAAAPAGVPARPAATGFSMGMGAFGRSGGFALPRLKARAAPR